MAGGIICKYDEYFDSFTGNCDPCKPICDASDCTQLCPYFSTITTTTSTTTTDTLAGEYNTNVMLIIFLVFLFISVVTTVMIVLYKRCRPIECICIKHQHKTHDDIKQPIQVSDDLLVTITLIS